MEMFVPSIPSLEFILYAQYMRPVGIVNHYLHKKGQYEVTTRKPSAPFTISNSVSLLA